jgi:hypothetical protein
MCSQCEGYSDKIRVNTPYEFLELISQLKTLVSRGVFLVSGNCDLNSIKEDKVWPQDNIILRFECSRCKQIFNFDVETYHGSGGYWLPEEECSLNIKGLKMGKMIYKSPVERMLKKSFDEMTKKEFEIIKIISSLIFGLLTTFIVCILDNLSGNLSLPGRYIFGFVFLSIGWYFGFWFFLCKLRKIKK